MSPSLRGAQFWLTGEPIRHGDSGDRRGGADAAGAYGSSGSGGPIAYGCSIRNPDRARPAPRSPRPRPGRTGCRRGRDLSPRALLSSSLRATALVLFNVAIGTRRRSSPPPAVPAGRPGLGHDIPRGAELREPQAGGMSIFDHDIVEALRRPSPSFAAGQRLPVVGTRSPGHPRLRLLVHPRLGALDSRAVVETLLEAIGAGHGVERVTKLAWRDAGSSGWSAERRSPETSKIRHFHLGRRGRPRLPRFGVRGGGGAAPSSPPRRAGTSMGRPVRRSSARPRYPTYSA